MCQINDIFKLQNTGVPAAQNPDFSRFVDSGDCMMHMKLIAKCLAIAGFALAVALPAHAEKTELNVYTALETDQLKA